MVGEGEPKAERGGSGRGAQERMALKPSAVLYTRLSFSVLPWPSETPTAFLCFILK